MQHQRCIFAPAAHAGLLCSREPEWRLSAAAPAFAFDADFLQTSAGGVLGTADDSELEQTLLNEGWAKQRGENVNRVVLICFDFCLCLNLKRRFKGDSGWVWFNNRRVFKEV